MFEHAIIKPFKTKDSVTNIMAIELGKFNSRACAYDSNNEEQQFETISTWRLKTLQNSCSPETGRG